MSEHRQEHHVVGAASGLAAFAGGYALELACIPSESDLKGRLDLWILDRNGRAVGDFDEQHEQRMHLIVVRYDLSYYQHLYLAMSADGTWSIPLILPESGLYRVFANFAIEGEPLRLGTDPAAPGDYEPRQPRIRRASHAPTVYDVVLNAGTVATRAETGLIFSVTRKGQEVGDLNPYLGALGHLVRCAKATSPTCTSTPWAVLARGSRFTPHFRVRAATGSSSSLLMKGEYIRRHSHWKFRLDRQPSRFGDQTLNL